MVWLKCEIISMVILLPSADSFKKGCSQLQAKSMCMNYWLIACSSLPRKSAVRWTDCPPMTIAVDLGREATKHQQQQKSCQYLILRGHDYRILTYLIWALWVHATYLFTDSFIKSCDSPDWLIQTCYCASSSRFTEIIFLTWPSDTCFKICLSAENIIIVLLNTVIPITVIV